MVYYEWDPVRSERLRVERGLSFEQIVMHTERGDVLSIYDHPNQVKYPRQRIIVVDVENYAFIVPFVESGGRRFLKTIIPSRKATREFFRRLT